MLQTEDIYPFILESKYYIKTAKAGALSYTCNSMELDKMKIVLGEIKENVERIKP